MDRIPPIVTFRSAAGWVALVLLAMLVLCAVAQPSALRGIEWHGLPPWQFLLSASLFVAVAVGFAAQPRRLLPHALMAASMAACWLNLSAPPLGDHDAWRNLARSDVLTLSEPLANLSFRLAQVAFGESGLGFVAPVFGTWAVFAYLGFVERAVVRLAPSRESQARSIGALVFVASGLPLLFFRGYVENAMLSVPPLLHGLTALHAYAADDCPRELRSRLLLKAGAWLACAGLVHGVSAPSIVAAACCTAVVNRPWQRPGAWAKDFGLLSVAVVGVVTLALSALTLAGFSLHEGHAAGGADQSHFTPLRLEGALLGYPFTMFDMAHFVDVGNILLATVPLCVFASVLLMRTSRQATAVLLERHPALGVAAFGSLLCTTMFGFDLGFPLDYDLMATMPLPLALLLLQVAVAVRPLPLWMWCGFVAGLAHCLLVLGALVIPTQSDHPLGDRGAGTLGESDLLTINGRSASYEAHAGETLVCQLRPPAAVAEACRFTLYFHRMPLTAPATILSFAGPWETGFDATRTLPYCDGLGLHPGAPVAVPLEHVLTFSRLPVVPGWGDVVVQALFAMPDGTRAASNAVLVRMP